MRKDGAVGVKSVTKSVDDVTGGVYVNADVDVAADVDVTAFNAAAVVVDVAVAVDVSFGVDNVTDVTDGVEHDDVTSRF